MKPIISVFDTQLAGKDILKLQLENLGKKKETKGMIEYIPKNKKATEVIKILRENGIEYQIRFDTSASG
jgi:hypothetical protein